jgi:hypothetical protein
MATSTPHASPVLAHQLGSEANVQRAFRLLRTVFTIAPIAFGIDKFFNVMTDWSQYLAPWINDIVPGNADQAMYAVGVIEIVAGLVVAVTPRFGGLLVAAWLAGIIVNLLTLGDYYDVALRDFGLFVAALALSLLATPSRTPAGGDSVSRPGQSGDMS